jgi:hypothetical protein
LRAKWRVVTGRPVALEDEPGWVWNRLGDPYSNFEWSAVRFRAALDGRRRRAQWAEVERFCFFIGYPRSGHTLVGSLLNAHPDIVIAHELQIHRFLERGFSRDQLFSRILERDRIFGTMGRKWTGYDYDVPGQFQGSVRRLRVIGDKLGGGSSRAFGGDPDQLDRLRDCVGVPLRVLHITRNPFDNIATMVRRHHLTMTEGIDEYANLCELAGVACARLQPGEVLDMAYESFVAQPSASLAKICAFLDVDASAEYLEACAGVVWVPGSGDAPRPRSRDAVEWEPADIARVDALIERYEVLSGYTFDS